MKDLLSVKLALKKTLVKSILSYEELETILCKTKDVINCRPLVYLNDDDMHNALTPFHLLYRRGLLIENERTPHV